MSKSTPRSSSVKQDGKQVSVSITLPTAWSEVEEPLLVYILRLLAAGFTYDDIRVYIVLHTVPHRVVRLIPTEQLAAAAFLLTFINTPPDCPLRPIRLGSGRALHAELQGIPFADYLIIENLWQGFIDEQAASNRDQAASRRDQAASRRDHDASRRDEAAAATEEALGSRALRALLPRLYTGYREKKFEPWHALAVIYWMQGLKNLFAATFPNLFRTASGTASATPPDMRTVMETQIRALTDGDITKREAVLTADTWAALTELDAKAREAEEINATRKK